MTEATLVIALIAFVFFQISNLATDEIRKIYARQKEYLSLAPPPWLFGIMWTVIYTFMVVSGYFAFYVSVDTVELVMFVLHIMLNKYWSLFYFDQESPKMALITLLGMFGTGITYLVYVGMRQNWYSFYFFLFPNMPWLLGALLWNVQIAVSTPTQKKTSINMFR